MVGAITGILIPLAGLAAPIVVPISASLALAKWVYEVYQASCVPLLFPIDKTLSLCQRCSSPTLHNVHRRLDYHLTNTISCVGRGPGSIY
jgi:hypothetical protein